LEKIFVKHTEPNLLIFFINQADHSKKTNCPEIFDILKWTKSSQLIPLLNGTDSEPLDRKVLYITIPCILFLYPELKFPSQTRDEIRNYYFNQGNNEPGYPPIIHYDTYGKCIDIQKSGYVRKLFERYPPLRYKQRIKNIFYDKYGRMLHLPNDSDDSVDYEHQFIDYYGRRNRYMTKIPYYEYKIINQRDYPTDFQNLIPTTSHSIRYYNKSEQQKNQGQNKFQRYVKQDRQCTKFTNIHKNEIDDYMIGLLLFIHYKLKDDCKSFAPYNPKWILFSEDKYRWMNQEIINQNTLIKKSNLHQYLDNPITENLYDVNIDCQIFIQQNKLYSYQPNLSLFLSILQNIIKINKS
jgi:hypothetical protein